MKLWVAMLAAMLLAGGTGEALAAPSPSCKIVTDAARAADLAAIERQQTASATDKEKTQALADAADAVLFMEAARLGCTTPGDDADAFQSVTKNLTLHQGAVTAALGANDCLPVLAAVQNRLVEMAKGLEKGLTDPAMAHVLGGALAVNEQGRGKCTGEALAAAQELAQQGAAVRAAYVAISTCQPAQASYQKTLDMAAAIVAEIPEADYEKFVREDYDPALASMKASCAELINAQGLAANDARVRDFARFKSDVLKARERNAGARP